MKLNTLCYNIKRNIKTIHIIYEFTSLKFEPNDWAIYCFLLETVLGEILNLKGFRIKYNISLYCICVDDLVIYILSLLNTGSGFT